MASIFTKIIHGEIPSYKIAEDEHYYAFLDINPNAVGHTLCVPKEEVDKIFDLSEETYMGLMKFSRKVGIAIEKAIPCLRVGMTVIGLEVPHTHVHLIPLHGMGSMDFSNKETLSPEDFEAVAAKIRAEL
ncbi:MAG: HIT family protein [Bacteroidota bacterium]